MRVCNNTLATFNNTSKYLVRAHFALAARTLNLWLSFVNLTLFLQSTICWSFYQLFCSHRKFVIIALKKKIGNTLKIQLYFITVFEAIKTIVCCLCIITPAVSALRFLPLSINHSFRHFHTHTQRFWTKCSRRSRSFSLSPLHPPPPPPHPLTLHFHHSLISLRISPMWRDERWVGDAFPY